MKKIIGAFTAGQALQLLILSVGQEITYETNLALFSVVLGILATLMLLVGSAIASFEYVSRTDTDMEEAAAIPESIRVSNDKVEREEPIEIRRPRPITMEGIKSALEFDRLIEEVKEEAAKGETE